MRNCNVRQGRLPAAGTLVLIAIALMVAVSFGMPQTAEAKSKTKSVKPAKVTGVKAKVADYQSVTIQWDKAKNAKKYEVYRATKKDGKYKLIKTLKKKSYTDKGLKTGTKYYYKVRGISAKKKGSKAGKKSKAVSAAPVLGVPKLTCDPQGEGIHLTVKKKISGADGYVFYRDDEELTDQAATTYLDEAIQAETSGSYKVQAYRTVGEDRVLSEASETQVVTRPAVFVDIEQVTAPTGQLYQGRMFTIKGRIYSNLAIQQVTARIYDYDPETKVANAITALDPETNKEEVKFTKTVKNYDTDASKNEGNPKEFRILKKIDDYIKFGELEIGNYKYKVIVTLADGTKKTMVNKNFEIIEQPNVTGGAGKIASKAEKLAWPYGTSVSKYKYSGGNPTSAYKKALETYYKLGAPDNRKKWGARPKAGASCDVFVGTTIRATGYDPKFERGLSDIPGHVSKNKDLWEVHSKWSYGDENKFQRGDVIYMEWNGGDTGHVCIYLGSGKVANAHFGSGGRYGVIESYSSIVKKRSYTKFIVYRAKK